MLLKHYDRVKKPLIADHPIMYNENIDVQLIDYIRCVDLTDLSEDDNLDCSGDDTYSEESQKKLSEKCAMLIKIFGVTSTGQSIAINVKNFRPFFYIKVPDDWTLTECKWLISYIKSVTYSGYREHKIDCMLVKRKPFTEFTGDDTFNFLKLTFDNKEIYDHVKYKFMKPIRVRNLNCGQPHTYDLYESNIDPIIKFIHMSKIKPSGWVTLPARSYRRTREQTCSTDLEVDIDWNQIQPLDDRIDCAALNIMAFDIESSSSHGDFPVGIKNYQKLSQDLITLYNEQGISSKNSTIHQLFKQRAPMVIKRLLHLVFNDNYCNTFIHQIHTIGNVKPHSSTLDQLQYVIYNLVVDNLTPEQKNIQLHDLLEYNLPPVDTTKSYGSHYQLLTDEILIYITQLTKNHNHQYEHFPSEVIKMMLELAFDDDYDGFQVNNVYTKENAKPESLLLDSLVPDVLEILDQCAQYTHFKKIPSYVKSTEYDDVSQDYFVHKLTELFNYYLPPVEGDKLIQIGSTCQLIGQSDCYLKHIMCLGSCDEITNDEMIILENKDIDLPDDDLAHDLVMYDVQVDKTVVESDVPQLIKQKQELLKKCSREDRRKYCTIASQYRRFKQTTTDHATVIVECFDDERDLLLAWQQLVELNDPDMIIGYNVFGFDFKFLYDRASELGCRRDFCKLSRIQNMFGDLCEQKLSSAGLGDNTLRYIHMSGRVPIDLYKVVQNTEKLDSYKLTKVCHKYLYKEKVDVSPMEIFQLQKGTSVDRKRIASYCLVDCILCNRLATRLEIIGNNIAMANVCLVPFPYLFLRGQGVKIFSLVADYCDSQKYLIKVLPKADLDNDDSYEGAIVLNPKIGIHFDPVVVGDFNSLYPSSMISENISHDSYVEIGGKYDNLSGYTYNNITYDMYKYTVKPGTKKRIKVKTGEKVCRYAQLPDGKKSIIPSILQRLLDARKDARKRGENEKDPFKAKIWYGLQLAYKITANSLYGQCGARTSPIYKVDIAASTTAVGRSMITFSKQYIETKYKNATVSLDLEYSGVFDNSTKSIKPTKYTGMTIDVKDTVCVYGDTDSVFIKFGMYDHTTGQKITGIDAVFISMSLCKEAVKNISKQLKRPQNIEFEKAIWPFIIITKKRYHGHYYTKMDNPSFYPNSMGIALKRRDNAPIVKHILGGSINIIMNEHDVDKAWKFVEDSCQKMLNGEYPLDMFVISKTLRSYYKKPKQIAHNVLAQRQAQRDPGNKFEPNDRVPYAYTVNKCELQGDKIETPEFITRNKLKIDYVMYLTNQIMKPVAQIFEIVPGYEHIMNKFKHMLGTNENIRLGCIGLDGFITKSTKNREIVSVYDLIKQSKITSDSAVSDDEDEESDTCEGEDNE